MRCKLFGISLFISFWLILAITYGIISSGKGQPLILICIVSALLHELGHIGFIIRYKEKPSEIIINPFETKIVCNLADVSNRQDIIITVSGVFVNLIICIISISLYFLLQIHLFFDFSVCNLSLLILNLLPVESTDGGQLLNIFLHRWFTERTVNIICAIISCSFIFPLIIAGVYVLFVSQYNYSLLIVGIYFLIFIINKELR